MTISRQTFMALVHVGVIAASAAVAGEENGPDIVIGLPDRLAAPPAEEKAGRVALKVSSAAGLPRCVFPISGGIPLPAGELLQAEHAGVVDAAGAEVPSQCSALARWPDGSVRWLLVETQTDLGALPALFLEYGPTVTRKAMPQQALKIEEAAEAIAFSTGSLRWRVAKAPGFCLFDLVELGGKALTGGNGPCGPVAGEAEGSRCAPTEFRVEEAGPGRATLLARGVHQDAGGKKHLSYVVRATIWAGLPFVKVEHTFIQTDDPIYGNVRDVGIALPLAGATQAVFGTNPTGDRTVLLDGGGATLLQRSGEIQQDHWRFPYVISRGAEALANGERAPGLVAEIPVPRTEAKLKGLYTTAKEVFVKVPETGPAKPIVSNFLNARNGFRLCRPDGTLFAERHWIVKGEEPPQVVEIPSAEKARGGIWRVEFAAAKNWIAVEGIPPYVASEPGLFFVPEAKAR
jgi:hypothetical protein